MKQTAVEWLWSQLPSDIYKHFLEEFEQAKEMEKEQIMNACQSNAWREPENGEQYYNETFKTR